MLCAISRIRPVLALLQLAQFLRTAISAVAATYRQCDANVAYVDYRTQPKARVPRSEPATAMMRLLGPHLVDYQFLLTMQVRFLRLALIVALYSFVENLGT